MDFSYSEEQQAIFDLAHQILSDGATQERMRGLERGDGPRFDSDLWKQLAESGLLGVAVPEEQGGAGLGFVEVAAVVQQLGRSTAPVPWMETVVLGAMPIAKFGSETQKNEWLPKVVEGDCILTAALTEAQAETARPQTRAQSVGDAWRLDGSKICVPAGQLADRVIVPATGDNGEVLVFLVDPRSPGAKIEELETTSGQPEANLGLDAVTVTSADLLGGQGEGATVLHWLTQRATAALTSLALGVCEYALELTSDYIKERKQFDQPLAMFQAVGHRAADVYVDTEAIRLTSWQAAWRLGDERPAETEVAVAKFWAAEGGQRVVHAASHLHGGVGVDRDYPLHRCFLYAKQLELTLGGATPQLLSIGKMLADQAA